MVAIACSRQGMAWPTISKPAKPFRCSSIMASIADGEPARLHGPLTAAASRVQFGSGSRSMATKLKLGSCGVAGEYKPTAADDSDTTGDCCQNDRGDGCGPSQPNALPSSGFACPAGFPVPAPVGTRGAGGAISWSASSTIDRPGLLRFDFDRSALLSSVLGALVVATFRFSPILRSFLGVPSLRVLP